MYEDGGEREKENRRVTGRGGGGLGDRGGIGVRGGLGRENTEVGREERGGGRKAEGSGV